MLDAGIDAKMIKYIEWRGPSPCGSIVSGSSTALCGAAIGGHSSTVRILLNQGCHIRRFNRDAFECAASVEHFDILKIFFESGQDVIPSIHRTFCSAAHAGNTKLTEFLIDHGFNIDLYLTR